MKPAISTLLLVGGLAGIVGLLFLDKPATRPVVVAAKSEGAAPRPGAAPEALQVPERRTLARSRGELFVAPPPPPRQLSAPAGPSAPTPVVAPPVPYRFAGKVRRGSDEEILISKGDLVFPVKAGDTLDSLYKVESIGAERIELLYLPLGTTSSIAVSSALEAERAQVPVADARPAQLRWEGPPQVQAGASFTVVLRLSTTQALRAAPMQIRFEPDVLDPVSVRAGKFFAEGTFTYRVNPRGSIFIGAASPPAAPGADAELVIVTFKPIKRGAIAELSMSALSLQGVAGAIAHEQVAAFRAPIH